MFKIIASLDNEILAEHDVRNSFYQAGGEAHNYSELNADMRAMQDGSFFAALTNRTFLYDSELAIFEGFHGVRLTTADTVKAIALLDTDGLNMLCYPYPAGEHVLLTEPHVACHYIYPIRTGAEIFITGKAYVADEG